MSEYLRMKVRQKEREFLLLQRESKAENERPALQQDYRRLSQMMEAARTIQLELEDLKRQMSGSGS